MFSFQIVQIYKRSRITFKNLKLNDNYSDSNMVDVICMCRYADGNTTFMVMHFHFNLPYPVMFGTVMNG